MTFGSVLYGPESEPYNIYSVVTPAPGDNGSGGQVARRGLHPLGQQLVLEDGRKFRFALGGALLVVGNVIQTADVLTTSEDLTCAAGSVGDRIITFTHSATPAVNFFAEGSAVISITPGGGHLYKVASHATIVATSGQVVNLAPGHALRAALTSTSRLDLRQHPYANVVQFPVTTATGAPVGVAVSAIASGGTGWLQTRGVCAVLTDATPLKGESIVVPSAAAGAAGPFTDTEANSNAEIVIGQTLAVAASWSTVLLTIDG